MSHKNLRNHYHQVNKHTPKAEVYRLSSCGHTLCKQCVDTDKLTCPVCAKRGVSKMDSYISSIASQLTNINLEFEDENKLTKMEMNSSTDKSVVFNEANENGNTEDRHFFDNVVDGSNKDEYCTPNEGISSPDVLEETPQEKTLINRPINRLSAHKRKLFNDKTATSREPEGNSVSLEIDLGEHFIEQNGIPVLTPHSPQQITTGIEPNAVLKNATSNDSSSSMQTLVSVNDGNQSFDEPLPCLTPYMTKKTTPDVRVKRTAPTRANTEQIQASTKSRRQSRKLSSDGNLNTSKDVFASDVSAPDISFTIGSKNPKERPKLIPKRSLASKDIRPESKIATPTIDTTEDTSAVETSLNKRKTKLKMAANTRKTEESSKAVKTSRYPCVKAMLLNDPSSDSSEFNPLATSTPSLETSFNTGKDKEKRNAKGETRLHIACRLGSKEKVIQLLNEGLDVNAKDHANWTPLHDLVSGSGSLENKLEIIDLLYKDGCILNAVGGDGDETALHKAVLQGSEPICSKLLLLNADPNILDRAGHTAKFYAKEDIVHLFEHTPSYVLPENRTYNFNRFVVYFSEGVSEDIVKSAKTNLQLKFSKQLNKEVTHIVYPITGTDKWVPKTWDYIYGIARRMWHVSCDWITESIKSKSCLNPTEYEVQGCYDQPIQKGLERTNIGVPGIPRLCRVSMEDGDPGLLSGFNIYLYKDCKYESIPKSFLSNLIQAADGTITNRQPNPDTIDPTDFTTRFYGSNETSPFVMTSHVILYSQNSVPPENKMFKLEHVKTLSVNWLLNSLLGFTLINPEKY